MDEHEHPQHNPHHRSIDPKTYNITPGRCTKRFLNAGDSFISLFVISPLVIAHWHGSWAFMDYWNDVFSPWYCFMFGLVLHTIIALLREFLYEQFKSSGKTKRSVSGQMLRCFLTKLYAYIFSMGCNMQWRGGWAVLDQYAGMIPTFLHIIPCAM